MSRGMSGAANTISMKANTPATGLDRADMAAKKGPHYQMGSHHRDKIKNSNILSALIEHVEGKRDMSSSQVTAGLGLLRKIMPDLAITDVTSGGEKINFPTEIILRAADVVRND